MNICFFTRELPLGSYTGGMGVYIYNLALGLSELKHQVHIITIDPKIKDKKINSYLYIWKAELENQTNKYTDILPQSSSMIQFASSFWKTFNKINNGAKITFGDIGY